MGEIVEQLEAINEKLKNLDKLKELLEIHNHPAGESGRYAGACAGLGWYQGRDSARSCCMSLRHFGNRCTSDTELSQISVKVEKMADEKKEPEKRRDTKKIVFPYQRFQAIQRWALVLSLVFGTLALTAGPDLRLIFIVLCIGSILSVVVVSINAGSRPPDPD